MVSQKMKVPIKTPNKDWSLAIESNYNDEAQLQEIIYKHPQIIPLEDINPECENRKLFTIKELGLPCGSTDVVIIDDKGEIYVIETKLATNNEIKRTVIGQILEYAAYLWQQDFEWLDRIVRKKHDSGLSEQFQNIKDWVKEDFEDAVANNLREGIFKLVIVVDKVNDGLRRITEFTNKRGLAVHPVELRYFKDKGGIEVLVPTVFNVPQIKKTVQVAKRDWDEETFFEDAKAKTDEKTFSTLKKLYEFSKDLGSRITWGHGRVNGTFGVEVDTKDKQIPLFTIYSTGKRNWFSFDAQIGMGVDEAVIVEYLKNLEPLSFITSKLDEVSRLKYPEFDVSVLNDEAKFEIFKKETIKFKNRLTMH